MIILPSAPVNSNECHAIASSGIEGGQGAFHVKWKCSKGRRFSTVYALIRTVYRMDTLTCKKTLAPVKARLERERDGGEEKNARRKSLRARVATLQAVRTNGTWETLPTMVLQHLAISRRARELAAPTSRRARLRADRQA